MALMLLAASCVPEAESAEPPAPIATSPVTTTSPAPVAPSPSPTVRPAPEPAEPIVLPPLPTQGVAIEHRNGVLFVDFEGTIVARLHRTSLYSVTGLPGSIIFRRHHHYFLLRAGLHVLEPLPSKRAADRREAGDQEGIDIPPPHGAIYEGVVTGHWRYVIPSPDGTMLLAQWSGECEVPTAFFVSVGDGRSTAVTGQWGLRHTFESFALGWTADDRAVVVLPQGACGGGMERPGVYLFDEPGRGELLFPVRPRHPPLGVAMWDTP